MPSPSFASFARCPCCPPAPQMGIIKKIMEEQRGYGRPPPYGGGGYGGGGYGGG